MNKQREDGDENVCNDDYVTIDANRTHIEPNRRGKKNFPN